MLKLSYPPTGEVLGAGAEGRIRAPGRKRHSDVGGVALQRLLRDVPDGQQLQEPPRRQPRRQAHRRVEDAQNGRHDGCERRGRARPRARRVQFHCEPPVAGDGRHPHHDGGRGIVGVGALDQYQGVGMRRATI